MSDPMRPCDVRSVVKRLTDMSRKTVRRDYRETAALALRLIAQLSKGKHGGSICGLAQYIADRAAIRPLLVYRTKKTGEIRWQAADTPSVVRIPQGQIVGVYDKGSDYRAILEDLKA